MLQGIFHDPLQKANAMNLSENLCTRPSTHARIQHPRKAHCALLSAKAGG